ncbi:MAG: translation initiation factor IF-2 subunit beta [Thermoplasmata archaeon]|nr:MAG: translation initiation factor IF-2 subunit beta [Thermoplasmata archaeon]
MTDIMKKYDYDKLLARAHEKLPTIINSSERFQVPEVDLIYEGKTSILRNYGEIIDVINRDADHLLKYLLREIGTAGSIDGKRVTFKGKVAKKQVEDRILNYVDIYVLCSECHRPDTKLIKEGRTLILECDACGAHRPVKVKKGTKTVQKSAEIEEGQVIDVLIQDVGKKGDGIAKKGRFVIFVPGTTKGVSVKIQIEKITGNVVFGKVVS